MSDRRFPGAPPGAWVSEEGWLIVGDQAWTEREWGEGRGVGVRPADDRAKYRNRYATDEERAAAKRRASRDYNRRVRAEKRRARQQRGAA